MYEAFYGLTERPFNLTPDPRFLFLSEKHKEAFAHLMYGIQNRTGFIMVSGEVGTGKTTICRSLLNQLDEGTEVAFIFNPALSPEELLRKINEDFGIDSQGQTVKDLIDELNTYLLERNAEGKNCVLVIDEAQNLKPPVLEQIRLLSNLETETQKLLQIVLIGQPELAQHLQLPELRQLNQRIAARYHLKPLDSEETLQYIAYRLSVAGGRRKVRFTPGAVRAVYHESGGTPRVINAICDRALLIGYTQEARDISSSFIKRAAREIRGEVLRPRKDLRGLLIKSLVPNTTLVVTALVVVVLVRYLTPVQYVDVMANGARANASAADPAEPAVSAEHGPDVAQTPKAAAHAPAEAVPLAERLRAWEPEASRRAAAAGLLRAWNMADLGVYPAGDAPEEIAGFGQGNGLSSEILTPALDQLLSIGLPAFTRMSMDGKSLWVTLLGVDGYQVYVSAPGAGAIRVGRGEFLECYAGEAVVFWRETMPRPRVLRTPMSGPDVDEFKERLQALARLPGTYPREYDAATAQAVARLQAETGLAIDGIAGPQVRMVLSSWFPDPQTPSLKGFTPGGPEPKPVVAAARAVSVPAPEPSPDEETGPAIPAAPVPTASDSAAEPPLLHPVPSNPLPDLFLPAYPGEGLDLDGFGLSELGLGPLVDVTPLPAPGSFPGVSSPGGAAPKPQ